MAEEDLTDRVRIRDEHVLSQKRYKLSEYDLDYRRSDGTWQRQNREIFDRKHAAAVLPIDPKRGTVILVSQFRLPAFLTGHRKPLVEVIAGALDNDAPDVCAHREAMEEAGVEVSDLKEVFNCFMSPGAITERIHLFVGTYSGRAGKGGGLHDEGEDIEVLEMPLDDAMTMIRRGEIVDAKTIALLQHAKLEGLA
ncbi:MAG TPA: NUDIX domain-containing protein [Rhizomicrobium sp.]|nr:NUDIX domain-containing protein [Rhizomicrobium sp.]